MTGPITHAISAMRVGHGTFPGDDGRFFAPAVQPLEQKRSALADVTIPGLIDLFEAHREASGILVGHMNLHRATNDRARKAVLEAETARHDDACEAIARELMARRTTDGWNLQYRCAALIGWLVEREEWDDAQRLLDEAKSS